MPTVPSLPDSSVTLNSTDWLWLTQGTSSTRDKKLSLSIFLSWMHGLVTVWRASNVFQCVVSESGMDVGGSSPSGLSIQVLNETWPSHFRNVRYAKFDSHFAGKPPMRFTIHTDPTVTPSMDGHDFDVPVWVGVVGGTLTNYAAHAPFLLPACHVVSIQWNGTYAVILGMTAIIP